MSNLKRISVSYELNLLGEALRAAQIINDQRLDGELSPATSSGVAATLVLARQRVQLLSLAVRDLIDPALLWCPENSAPPADGVISNERTPVLVSWSERKRAKRGWMAWKRAQQVVELDREQANRKHEHENDD